MTVQPVNASTTQSAALVQSTDLVVPFELALANFKAIAEITSSQWPYTDLSTKQVTVGARWRYGWGLLWSPCVEMKLFNSSLAAIKAVVKAEGTELRDHQFQVREFHELIRSGLVRTVEIFKKSHPILSKEFEIILTGWTDLKPKEGELREAQCHSLKKPAVVTRVKLVPKGALVAALKSSESFKKKEVATDAHIDERERALVSRGLSFVKKEEPKTTLSPQEEWEANRGKSAMPAPKIAEAKATRKDAPTKEVKPIEVALQDTAVFRKAIAKRRGGIEVCAKPDTRQKLKQK